jgi:hypothetical protein
MASPRTHDRSNASAAAWTIEELVARQAFGASAARPGLVAGSIRLDHPASGIVFDGGDETPWSGSLLGLVLDPAAERAAGGQVEVIPPTDRWVRGDDVVAIYEPQDPRSLRATAMWRRWPTEKPSVAAWELVVSCQTSLLESDATVSVRTLIPAGEIASQAATAALLRTASGTSVLVATHPLEARRLTIRAEPFLGADAAVAIECHLFPSVVEKGVLLRGRVLAAVGPRENDTEWSARLLDAFAASPPPLTT